MNIRMFPITCCLVMLSASCATTDKVVVYESTNEKTNCLNATDIESISAQDDQTLIFRLGPSRYYRNQVTKGCHQAKSPFRRFEYDVRAASLCKGETIRVVDNSDNITAGFCQLREFEKVTRVKE